MAAFDPANDVIHDKGRRQGNRVEDKRGQQNSKVRVSRTALTPQQFPVEDGIRNAQWNGKFPSFVFQNVQYKTDNDNDDEKKTTFICSNFNSGAGLRISSYQRISCSELTSNNNTLYYVVM